MNSQRPKVKSENKKIPNRRRSRAIIAVLFGIVIGTVVLLLAIMGAVSHFNKPADSSGDGTLIFHEADYTYDIMSDPQYLDLDRNIYFENTENGMKTAIIDGNLEDVPTEQHKHVALLCDFVNYAINGQNEELNALFSDEYIEAEGKIKMDFTMQQLYNIKITYIQLLSEEVEGNTHVSYDYWLEYMIRKNNGTFRNDMESDCVRKEYVRVTDRNGVIGIDVLSPYRTEPQQTNLIDADMIISIAAISIFLIAGTVVCCYMILKKKRDNK